ncbi:UNVERIFIED_CONTAM: hypothetical protein LBW93_05395 [Wolbachia endosymbiont of Nasonia longicornis]
MYPFSRVAKQGRREKITKWVSSQCLTIFLFFLDSSVTRWNDRAVSVIEVADTGLFLLSSQCPDTGIQLNLQV